MRFRLLFRSQNHLMQVDGGKEFERLQKDLNNHQVYRDRSFQSTSCVPVLRPRDLKLSGNRHRSYSWNKRANLVLRVAKKTLPIWWWKKGGKTGEQQTEDRKPFSTWTFSSVWLEFRAKLRNWINQKALIGKPNKFYQIVSQTMFSPTR